MPRSRCFCVLGVLVALAVAPGLTRTLYAQSSSPTQFQALSPWAEADPTPFRGLSAARLDNLAGKKIGLFANFKRAAMPIAQAVDKRLRSMYPDVEISYFRSTDPNIVE